ncbi:alcohol oxidase [Auriculariales sp. MPI-PUGE-AT-0066]|nr:alcohol oxidase [Auriculariales sp. MPI-PUGE-AT-0066]
MPPLLFFFDKRFQTSLVGFTLAIVMPVLWKSLLSSKRHGITSSPTPVGSPVRSPSAVPVLNENLDEFPEYDFVILGGGTAGCVLASRLSEDPTKRVLVLEAGGSGVAQLYSRIPVAFGKLFSTAADWTYFTTPQGNAEQRELFWPRGKLLGGCSSINANMFHYGNPTDFDEWSRISGSDEWSWKKFQKYFIKFETYTPRAEFPVKLDERGRSGPVQTGSFSHLSNWAQKFMQTCLSVGIQPRNDFNTSEGTLGVGKVLAYITSSGVRSSAESAYLTPAVLARPNLVVLTQAHITRILLAHDTVTGEKRAVGVEFASGKKKQRYRVRAKSEVIVSCGAVNTPHILQLSGIGPGKKLESYGIPVLHDLPGVGMHLMDHAAINIRFRVDEKESFNAVTLKGLQQIYAVPSIVQWLLNGTGPLLCNFGETVAFVRSDDKALFSDSEPEFQDETHDATSGARSPDLELFATPLGWWNHGLGNTLPVPRPKALCSVTAVLLRPTSTGEVTLKSSDPFDAPVVNPNYLASGNDFAVLRRGIRLLLRIAQAPPLNVLIDRTETNTMLDQKLHEATDAELDMVIRQRAETLYHPTSTARMAPLEDGGVVDAQLRVYGIKGLRVVDASVFPTINSGHTTAPVLALAEKAADLIRGIKA